MRRFKMVKTKGLERSVSKYQARVAVAGSDYKAGIQSPKRPWAENAANAASTWGSAIQEAVSRGSFEAGVRNAGDTKWREMSEKKGTARFSAGVDIGLPYYRQGMSENLSVIEGVTLGAKGPKGSAQNYERSKTIGDALRAAKLAGGK